MHCPSPWPSDQRLPSSYVVLRNASCPPLELESCLYEHDGGKGHASGAGLATLGDSGDYRITGRRRRISADGSCVRFLSIASASKRRVGSVIARRNAPRKSGGATTISRSKSPCWRALSRRVASALANSTASCSCAGSGGGNG